MKNSRYVFLITIVAACGGLLFGFDTAVISGVLPILKDYFNINELTSGWVVSILTIGCIVGVIFSSKLADKYGRKKMLYISAVFFLISAFGVASALNIYMFQIFRFIGGLGVGIASVASPMYIAEIAPADKRGRMVSINQLAIVGGILLAFFTNYILVNTGENNWRWMLVIMAIPALIFIFLLGFVPRSPRWLIAQGKIKEGKDVLSKILQEDNVEQEFLSISKSLKSTTENISLKVILKSSSKKILGIGIVLAILQQVTGINTIMYYAPTIFDSLGYSKDSALLQTIVIGIINFSFTIVSMVIIDKIGRKPLLLIGSGLMALSLGLLAYSVQLSSNKMFTLVLILVYIAAFAVSLGPVTWVLISEIFPNKYRGIGMSISTMFLWISTFFVTLFFPVLLSVLEVSGTFLLFSFICVLAFVFYSLFVKETKNIKLEDIECD